MAVSVLCNCRNEEKSITDPDRVVEDSSRSADRATEFEKPTEERTAEVQREVSYRRDVFPIFEAKCIGCHHANNAVRVILTDVFDPELGLINRPNSWTKSQKEILVVPGDPDASALMLKVESEQLDHKAEGDPMPWNIPRLTESELKTLRDWIESGAKDDVTYRSSIVRLFGDGVSLGSRGGKCGYCHHSGPGGWEPDFTNVFDPNTGAVGVEANRGGVRIAPGDAASSVVYLRVSETDMPPQLAPLMPKRYERLSEQEVRLLREWITLGARND